MHPRGGAWLIVPAGLVALGLPAAAQTRPGTLAVAPSPSRSSPSRPSPAAPVRSQPTNFFTAAIASLSQAGTRPANPAPAQGSTVAAAPPARPLPVNAAAAGTAANSAANARGRTAVARFISANASAINQVQIPVLLPSDPDLAGGLRIFPNGAFYTVSSKSNGMSFVLMGSGRAFPASPALTARLASRIPPDGIVIDGAEGGIDASFNRFGASYSISLECASPRTDTRCTGDAYIRGVIGRLMVVIPGTAK